MTIVLYAEYTDAVTLVRALHELRGRGYRDIEVYSPYPLPEVDHALGAARSRLGLIVAVVGFAALAGAYALQWLLNSYLYPLDVGGRPVHFPLAFVPISFEMGVLFASLTAVGAVFVGGRLLRLWHPVFEAKGFESASSTRFWLGLASDADPRAIETLLAETGAIAVRRVLVP
jgi:hypothetical protein